MDDSAGGVIYSPQMGEREPRKEIVGKGELFFLSHPGTEDFFSGYGLTVQPGSRDLLIGLLMIDRPKPADPRWLKRVENAFGESQLVPITAAGERGIACQMQMEPESLPHLRQFSTEKAAAIKTALQPLLEEPPNPTFTLRWNEEKQLWTSQIALPPFEMPEYEPQRVGYYRPRISPYHLRRLWLEKKRTKKPMTLLVAEALDEYFAGR